MQLQNENIFYWQNSARIADLARTTPMRAVDFHRLHRLLGYAEFRLLICLRFLLLIGSCDEIQILGHFSTTSN